MQLSEIWQQVVDYTSQISVWELTGLVAGLLAVVYLIRQSIWTWPFGILYVLVSFVVFWQARLYGDFLLHIFFLVLNVYGWLYWRKGAGNADEQIKITHSSRKAMLITLGVTVVGILVFAKLLIAIPSLFDGVDPPALPYWDSTTSVLSVAGMWLTARKRIDNWYYWFVVDVLATGIYFYKELYFYSALYLVYIGMAVAGYLAWKKSITSSEQ